MASLAVLMLTVHRSPYRHTEDQFLAASAQFMLLVSFTASMLIKAYEDVEVRAMQTTDPGMAAAVFGFDSSDGLVDLLIAFSVLMIFPLLFTTVGFSVIQAARAARRRADAEREAAAARGRMSNPPSCSWQLNEGKASKR